MTTDAGALGFIQAKRVRAPLRVREPMRRIVLGNRRRPLGGWQDTLTQALQQGVQRADPDLADVTKLAMEIVSVERQPGGLLDPRTPSTFRIADLKRPLRTYLYLRRHPALAYAIPIAIASAIFFLGRVTAPTKTKERA